MLPQQAACASSGVRPQQRPAASAAPASRLAARCVPRQPWRARLRAVCAGCDVARRASGLAPPGKRRSLLTTNPGAAWPRACRAQLRRLRRRRPAAVRRAAPGEQQTALRGGACVWRARTRRKTLAHVRTLWARASALLVASALRRALIRATARAPRRCMRTRASGGDAATRPRPSRDSTSRNAKPPVAALARCAWPRPPVEDAQIYCQPNTRLGAPADSTLLLTQSGAARGASGHARTHAPALRLTCSLRAAAGRRCRCRRWTPRTRSL
jgi:hypothetical protein